MPHIWNACNTRFYFTMYLVRNICCTGYPVFQHVTEVAAPLAPTEDFEVVPPENSLHFLLILLLFPRSVEVLYGLHKILISILMSNCRAV